DSAAGGDAPPDSTIHTATPQEEAMHKAGFGWALAASGIVGGAVAAVVLLVFWFAGVPPVRDDGVNALRARVTRLETQFRDRPAAPDNKIIGDLSQRVDKIEAAVAKLPASDLAIAQRLTSAESSMKSLDVAMTAINRRSDGVADDATSAREHADAATNAVAKLQTAIQSASPTADRGEVDALNERIAALERTIKAVASSGTAVRLALSAASLRDAVMRGEPFAAQLAEVKSFGGDAALLAPLEPFAAAGVPKEAALARELAALIPDMLKVSGAPATAGGFFARLQANAGNLVHVRPVDAPSGNDPADRLARIEVAAAHNDIAGAMADIARLPSKTRASAEGWLKKAQARQAAIDASRKLAADTAHALGKS
ncbi:MAG TPA: hypothetical protein VFX03_06155, partial [Thermomicrobiales bacterium]|nr:hypothetical protein [Thermomicrobiales bacterium]